MVHCDIRDWKLLFFYFYHCQFWRGKIFQLHWKSHHYLFRKLIQFEKNNNSDRKLYERNFQETYFLIVKFSFKFSPEFRQWFGFGTCLPKPSRFCRIPFRFHAKHISHSFLHFNFIFSLVIFPSYAFHLILHFIFGLLSIFSYFSFKQLFCHNLCTNLMAILYQSIQLRNSKIKINFELTGNNWLNTTWSRCHEISQKCYLIYLQTNGFYFSIFHLNATDLPSHLPVYPQPDFVLICKAFLAELSQFPSLCWYGFLKFFSSKITVIYWEISCSKYERAYLQCIILQFRFFAMKKLFKV